MMVGDGVVVLKRLYGWWGKIEENIEKIVFLEFG